MKDAEEKMKTEYEKQIFMPRRKEELDKFKEEFKKMTEQEKKGRSIGIAFKEDKEPELYSKIMEDKQGREKFYNDLRKKGF